MNRVTSFLRELEFADLPPAVVEQAKRCLLDLIGVAAGGRRTTAAGIACRFAARQLNTPGQGARILFDGRTASPAGAAYAGATMIDSLDAHDGHALTKGHAGAALLPALLAFVDGEENGSIGGRDLLTYLSLGYEIAIRAGIALHASAPDYHTSGAWNAFGCPAIGARVLELDDSRTREALGIAEYHGPRSQMMRCIDHPTMVKDGSGWGAFAGVSAAYLAADGFTGAPALTIADLSQKHVWDDLGSRWRILELYFKPEPICRWAQPATEAARRLRTQFAIAPQTIRSINVETFDAAVRLGSRMPETTEEAQYAIGFPVAVMLARGDIRPEDVMADALTDPRVETLCKKIELVERPDFTARFPQERLADLRIMLNDGRTLVSGETAARGDPQRPLSDADLKTKFDELTSDLDTTRREAISRSICSLSDPEQSSRKILDAILTGVT